MIENMGADIYKSWSEDQRRSEISRLVEGYRNGLPVPIICSMAAAIAGSEAGARKHMIKLLTLRERKSLIAKEAGSDETKRSQLSKFFL